MTKIPTITTFVHLIFIFLTSTIRPEKGKIIVIANIENNHLQVIGLSYKIPKESWVGGQEWAGRGCQGKKEELLKTFKNKKKI